MKPKTNINSVRESVSLPEELVQWVEDKIRNSHHLRGFSDYIQQLIRLDKKQNLIRDGAN